MDTKISITGKEMYINTTFALDMEYEEFQDRTFQKDNPLWATFDKWLENTHCTIWVQEDGNTLWKIEYWDGSEYIQGDWQETGDDKATKEDVQELLEAGKGELL